MKKEEVLAWGLIALIPFAVWYLVSSTLELKPMTHEEYLAALLECELGGYTCIIDDFTESIIFMNWIFIILIIVMGIMGATLLVLSHIKNRRNNLQK